MNHEYYCDNCIYNYTEAGKVLDFKEYNISANLDMIYAHIIKYSNLIFFNEHQRLFTANLTRGPQSVANQTCAYEEVLNNFCITDLAKKQTSKFQLLNCLEITFIQSCHLNSISQTNAKSYFRIAYFAFQALTCMSILLLI